MSGGANGGTAAAGHGSDDGPRRLSLRELVGGQAASFSFLRGGGWLRSARLALTGATPAQLLTEEVTGGGGSSVPDARALGLISRAAFDHDDRSRILQVLHKRLGRFDRKLWRESYKALIVVEHLLVHGPDGVAGEFMGGDDAMVIGEMSTLQYIDEKGFNWGLAVKNKSERVLNLLEDPSFLTQQRDQARKVSHEIQGFGSFNQLTLSSSSTSSETNRQHHALPALIARSNSHYESVSTEDYFDSDGGDGAMSQRPEPASSPETELFLLARGEEPPRQIRGAPGTESSGFCRDALLRIRQWPAEEEEEEPFLPRRRREAKRANDADEMGGRPFGLSRRGRESSSSSLLLSS